MAFELCHSHIKGLLGQCALRYWGEHYSLYRGPCTYTYVCMYHLDTTCTCNCTFISLSDIKLVPGDENGLQAVHEAASHNRLDCLKYLVKKGAKTSAVDKLKRTSTHVVCYTPSTLKLYMQRLVYIILPNQDYTCLATDSPDSNTKGTCIGQCYYVLCVFFRPPKMEHLTASTGFWRMEQTLTFPMVGRNCYIHVHVYNHAHVKMCTLC